MSSFKWALAAGIAGFLTACAPGADDTPTSGPGDDADAPFVGGKADLAGATADASYGVLAIVNAFDEAGLRDDLGLDSWAAAGIAAWRAGGDGALGSPDDRRFLDLATLDAVPYVGPRAFQTLVDAAVDLGLVGASGVEAFLTDQLDHLGGRSTFVLPRADDLAALPQDPKNPLTPAKVELGKHLFHDRGLAVNGKIPEARGTWSCASCHHADAGFSSGNLQGVAEGGMGFGARGEARRADLAHATDADVQPLKSPTALNIGYQTVTLWNGQFGAHGPNAGTEAQWTEGTPKAKNFAGYTGVETQALAGLAVHRLLDNEKMATSMEATCHTDPEYAPLVEAAFPGQMLDQEAAALAIAAYERTLVADRAPFQRWLRGDREAMSPEALRGAALFFGKADCVSCHTGPALSSDAFFRLGFGDLDAGAARHGMSDEIVLRDDASDAARGRGAFTGNPEDEFCFKVPQLYNLADHAFFGHGGTFRSVREVVAYKNAAVSENPAVGDLEIAPLGLSEREVDDLTAFLAEGLYDPELDRYVPAPMSERCGINGDAQSLTDLGCGGL